MEPLDLVLENFVAEARKRVWDAAEPASPLFPGMFTLVRELVLAQVPCRPLTRADDERADSFVRTLRKSRLGGVIELPPRCGARAQQYARELLEDEFAPAMRTEVGRHFVAFSLGGRVVCVLDEACYYPPERFLQDVLSC